MTGRLDGKVALLFGAGQVECDYEIWGNGRATTVAYARQGARVVAVDLRLQAAEETRSCVLEDGKECIALAADATQSSDVESVVEQTMDRFGRIDILHNNAGINEIAESILINRSVLVERHDD